jgi:hypothetical protein
MEKHIAGAYSQSWANLATTERVTPCRILGGRKCPARTLPASEIGAFQPNLENARPMLTGALLFHADTAAASRVPKPIMHRYRSWHATGPTSRILRRSAPSPLPASRSAPRLPDLEVHVTLCRNRPPPRWHRHRSAPSRDRIHYAARLATSPSNSFVCLGHWSMGAVQP